MSSLSTAFGSERIGAIVPGYFPGNKKYLTCDGVSESAVVPANAHLGVLFPRISGAQSKQYTNSSLRDIRPTQMAFGNGVYVVVGPYSSQTWGMCLSSTDGKKWVRREMPSNMNWTYVVWTGQCFIAFGGDNSASSMVARSEDGTVWTSVYTASIANVSGLWTAFGITVVRFGDGTYAYTMDGLTWSTTSLNIQPTKIETFKNVMYSAQGSQVYRSDNMINWEAWFNVTSNVDVASNGTVLFIASSSANASRYTTDGVNLVAVTIPGLKRVVWNGENFVAFGTGTVTTYYTSPDGINWTRYKNPMRGALYVGWGPELGFMMVNSQAAEIRTSADGVTWSSAKNLNIGLWFNGTVSYIYGVFSVNGIYFIMTNVGVFMTKDGNMWSARYLSGPSASAHSTAYVDGSGNLLYDMLTFVGNSLQNYVAKIETNVIRAPSYAPYPYNLNTYNYSLVIG